jgi:hypothetical protein
MTQNGGLFAAIAGGCAAVAYALHVTPLLHFQDAVQYLSLAEHLARGDGFRSSVHMYPDLIQPPLYPLLVAAGIRIGLGAVSAASLVTMGALALVILGVVRIHRLLFGVRGQLVTAVIASVGPLAVFGALLALELPSCALVVWAAAEAMTPCEAGRRRAMAAGGLAGLLLLVRPEGIVVSGAVLGTVLLGPWSPRRRVERLVLAASALALVAIPYGLWVRGHIGVFDVTPKLRYNLLFADVYAHMAWKAGEATAPAREMRAHHSLMPDHTSFVLAWAVEHPGFDPRPMFPRVPALSAARSLLWTARAVIGDGVKRLAVLHPLAIGCEAVVVAAAIRPSSFAWARVSRWRLAAVACWCGALSLPSLFAGDYYQSRFLLASVALALPIVGGGVALAAGAAAARWGQRAGRLSLLGGGAAMALLFAGGARSALATIVGPPSLTERTRVLDEACARWIRSGERVMVDRQRFAFVRGAEAFSIPYVDGLAELDDYARRNRIEAAIFDAPLLRAQPSETLRALARGDRWPVGWQLEAEVLAGTEEGPAWIVRIPPGVAPAP